MISRVLLLILISCTGFISTRQPQGKEKPPPSTFVSDLSSTLAFCDHPIIKTIWNSSNPASHICNINFPSPEEVLFMKDTAEFNSVPFLCAVLCDLSVYTCNSYRTANISNVQLSAIPPAPGFCNSSKNTLPHTHAYIQKIQKMLDIYNMIFKNESKCMRVCTDGDTIFPLCKDLFVLSSILNLSDHPSQGETNRNTLKNSSSPQKSGVSNQGVSPDNGSHNLNIPETPAGVIETPSTSQGNTKKLNPSKLDLKKTEKLIPPTPEPVMSGQPSLPISGDSAPHDGNTVVVGSSTTGQNASTQTVNSLPAVPPSNDKNTVMKPQVGTSELNSRDDDLSNSNTENRKGMEHQTNDAESPGTAGKGTPKYASGNGKSETTEPKPGVVADKTTGEDKTQQKDDVTLGHDISHSAATDDDDEQNTAPTDEFSYIHSVPGGEDNDDSDINTGAEAVYPLSPNSNTVVEGAEAVNQLPPRPNSNTVVEGAEAVNQLPPRPNSNTEVEDHDAAIVKPLPPISETMFGADVQTQGAAEDMFAPTEDSHFFAYFMTMIVLCIIGYLVFHNKQKILALALEGRSRRGSRRRPNTAGYRKLDSNLEEAVTSQCSGTSVTHVIY